ncbi:hypothetical protein PROFUN_04650 [Planoprotostelium fungivorum]|uniref:Uncharacterized protein n=1 Tax=Planoprotostelium fungivorum TaxID=1890364 RepID=A0A2P6NUH6_9EUKA|nr:hypothetical protein PROFUN_04650 [Planoprotostelium fungivorum]
MNGQPVYMQCKNSTGLWGPGPMCHALNEELHFLYGVDHLINCQWFIETNAQYNFFKRLIDREALYGSTAYIPFSLPVWGIVEADHIHIDIHINFVLHAERGQILGIAAYPVRDKFMPAKLMSVVPIHGLVKWFAGHTFRDYYPHTTFRTGSTLDLYFAVIFGWCIMVFLLTTMLLVWYYRNHLRPKLLRSVLKNE